MIKYYDIDNDDGTLFTFENRVSEPPDKSRTIPPVPLSYERDGGHTPCAQQLVPGVRRLRTCDGVSNWKHLQAVAQKKKNPKTIKTL